MRISVNKSELWCSPFRVCQAFLSPSLHETTINERADFKGPLGWRDCMSGHLWKKKKKKSHIALSLPLCLLSLPLRTDRSFDSGSKFTSQTCWEAGERSDGKAFLHFKDPERLPDSLSKILRLIINLLFFFFLHSCGCETSAEAPRVEERELQETNLYEATGWPNFFYGASDCSNSEGKKKSEIYHRCTRLQIQNASSVSDGVSFIKSAMELLMIP